VRSSAASRGSPFDSLSAVAASATSRDSSAMSAPIVYRSTASGGAPRTTPFE
jgi:hypothetical protein